MAKNFISEKLGDPNNKQVTHVRQWLFNKINHKYNNKNNNNNG